MSAVLASVGASIFLLLGIAHVFFTMQSSPDGGPMMPTEPAIREAMAATGGLGLAPQLQSSLYKAWIGFNYSHSLGVIATAAIILWHAVDDFGAVVDEPWFIAIVVVVPVVYLALAVNYWFDKPRNGIALGTFLLWVGLALELT